MESNPADVFLTAEALKQAGLSRHLTVFEDGLLALAHLRETAEPPDIVMLDLNIAPISGLELLAEIRRDPNLAALPVVMVSGSESRHDVRKAYLAGANCYINKPTKLDEYLRVMKSFYEFWGTVATLPRH